MNVSIFLETENIRTTLNDAGQEVTSTLPRRAPIENPIYIDNSFTSFLRVYVNDEAFKNNEVQLLETIAQYIKSLPEVNTISVEAEFWKEPVISAIKHAKKKGFSIKGDYTLSKEEYERMGDTEVINVAKCEECLLEQSNVFLTDPINPQSNQIFYSYEKICDAQKKSYLEIQTSLTPEMKHDLELLFKWNRDLKWIELKAMNPKEYLEVFSFLKPYLDKIPEIRIETNIKDYLVDEMKKIYELLGEQSKKVVVQYGTHLTENHKWDKVSCNLKEYIIMDEILSSYKVAIEAHDYSPLEKLIYAYDIVKSVDYKEATEDKHKSRELHSVVLGKEIVCVGYSNLLNGLLTKLGIPATGYDVSVYMNSYKEDAHQRSAIYLQDPKYGINGLFTCDPTWDAKSGMDLGYDRSIDRYNNFLLPYDRMIYRKRPENVNALSALSIKQNYLETLKHYELYQKQIIDLNKELGLIDTTVLEESEEFKALSHRDRVDTIYTFIRNQIPNFKQEIPFETIASAVETVRRTEGVYASEAELGQAIGKIITLHDQFKSLAFNEAEKTLYVEQDGKFQVLVTPVEDLAKEKIA